MNIKFSEKYELQTCGMNDRCEGLTNTVITLIYKHPVLVRVLLGQNCALRLTAACSVAECDVTSQLTLSFVVTTVRASSLTFYVTSV